MSCRLASLAAPELAAPLAGLIWLYGELAPDPAYFACCAGEGLIRPALGADAAVPTLGCALRKRFAAVSALERQFRRTWEPDGFRLEVLLAAQKGLDPAGVRDLHHVFGTSVKRGRSALAPAEGLPSAPSPAMWQLALAAAWRFGFDVELVTLDKASGKARSRPTFGHTAPAAIFVENARRLWETTVAEELERLICFAANAAFPVWLEVHGGAKPDSARAGATGGRDVRSQLAQRIDRAKARPPLGWLAPEATSRLASVSRLAAGLVPRVEKAPSPKTGKGKEFLPWSH